MRFTWVVIAWGLASLTWKSACGAGSTEVVDFNFQVKPILSDRCYTCHGPDETERQGGFRLDQYESAVGEADSGEHPIVPGDAATSEVIRRITASDTELRMPPAESKLSLTAAEIEILRRWIEQGGRWKPHWSFLSLESAIAPPGAPTNGPTDWARNEIDHFVLAKLAVNQLQPASEADRETLIRRLSFDLTGFPPTVDEIDAFVSDRSPDAYEQVVDRLLAAPSYGERMAVDWLDVARYADTYGYQEDRYRETWPWRDWVVEAFNGNMRYDEFITWQLAGDLLPQASDEQVLATAFNRLHRQTSEGGSVEEEFRTEYVVDRVDTFGSALLGLTIGCARCHDHKYDPILQKDYYRLFAFFNNIDESGLYPYFTAATPTPSMTLASKQQQEKLRELQQKVADAQAEVERAPGEQRAAFEAWLATPPTRTALVGLIGDFSFDTIEAGKIVNHADPKVSGELLERPQAVQGVAGMGLQFDGEDNFSTRVGGDFTRNDPFSISLWIKTPDAKERAVIWHRTRAPIDAGSRGYQLVMEAGKLVASLVHFWPGNALSIRTQPQLPVNQWVQVTVSYDGSSRARGLRVYWDGQLVACDVVRDTLTRRIVYDDEYNEVDTNNVARLAHRLAVGQRFRDVGFKGGLVDELKVFDRELSAHEVAALYSGVDTVKRLLEPGSARTAEQTEQLFQYYLRNSSAGYALKQSTLRTRRQEYSDALDQIAEVMVMREMPKRRATFVLARGAYDSPAEEVFAGTPSSLPAMADDLPRNRLGLARWLTDPAHPLTARVAVNRYWQSLFGQGLVATPLDFGSQGMLPSHPELLDWLSRSFIDSQWNIKQLLKLIVMSATYRQTSACEPALRSRDPLNTLLARGPRHRLAAEMIRDNALCVSGLLVERAGGPPVKPYQPAGLWKEKGSASYTRDRHEGSHRRSLYTFWKRTSPPPSMMTLDAAKRDVCVVQRQATTTPLQSLVLLNDPQYVEASRALAEIAMQSGGPELGDQISLAFRRATSRRPTSAELGILETLYAEQLRFFQIQPGSAAEFLDVGDHRYQPGASANELAALSVVVEAIMNLNESVTKQ